MLNSFKKFIRGFQFKVRDKKINRTNRQRLSNHDFTIICNDCIGGCLYKDLKQRFNSPTINLYFSAEDYITLIYNLKDFVNGEIREVVDKSEKYPKCKIVSVGGEKFLLTVYIIIPLKSLLINGMKERVE